MDDRQGDAGGIAPLAGFQAPPVPENTTIEGPWARLERLDAGRHGAQIHAGVAGDDGLWSWMPYGPFADLAAHRAWLAGMAVRSDPCFYAIVDPESRVAAGHAAFLRIEPAHGVIEIGHVMLGRAARRRRLASAALMALVGWAFEVGYRRVEWKCDACNVASRRAALRLGFSHEGVFHQHLIVKGRNRDTAWFAITDAQWPALRQAYATWLDTVNFDASGRQRHSLTQLTADALPGRHDG